VNRIVVLDKVASADNTQNATYLVSASTAFSYTFSSSNYSVLFVISYMTQSLQCHYNRLAYKKETEGEDENQIN